MKRRLVVAGAVLVGVVAVIWVAVNRTPVVTLPDRIPEPVVHHEPVAPVAPEVATSVVVTPDVETSAVPSSVGSPYVPAVVFSPGLAALVDRSLPGEERVHGLASGEMTEVKDARDLETLAQLLGDPAEDDTVRHEIASLLLRSGYAPLDACLLKVLENPAEKERFRSWAVQHVGNLLLDDKHPGDRRVLADRLRTLLTDRHIKVRREALLVLARHDDSAVLEKVRDMLADTGPGADEVRDLAIRLAQDKNMRELIPLIRPYAHATNEIIRIAAIVALSQWSDEESRPAFEAAASSSGTRLQRAGTAALARLEKAPATQPAR